MATPHQIWVIHSLSQAGRTADRIADCTGIPQKVVYDELVAAWVGGDAEYRSEAVKRLVRHGLNQRQIARGLRAPEAEVQRILLDHLMAGESA